MENGCFRSGVIISDDRAKIGWRIKKKAMPTIKSIDLSWSRRKIAYGH